MKSKRPLIPNFLNRLDDHLLINNPVGWSARTHLVLWCSLIFSASLLAICYMVPNDPRQYSDTYSWSLIVGIISALGLIFWLIYLLRFNPFKRFGIDKPGDGIKTFILYFFAIAGIIVPCFIPDFVESRRADKAYDGKELIDDINAINLRVTLLEKDSLPNYYGLDTCRVVDTLPKSEEVDEFAEDAATAVVDTFVRGYPRLVYEWRVIDAATLAREMQNSDTAWAINDSTVIFGTTPDYQFLNVYQCNPKGDSGVWNSQYLYRTVFYGSNAKSRKQLFDELKVLIRKYDTYGKDLLPNYEFSRGKEDSHLDYTRRKYIISSIENSFNNICRKKYRWAELGWPVYFRLFFYLTLSLSMLVFIFRHNTIKTFFLSLLTAVLLCILTALIFSMFNFGDTGVFISLMLYFALFTLFSFSVLKSKTRKAIQGIATNIFMCYIPFIFLLISGYYYHLKQMAYDKALEANPDIRWEEYFGDRKFHFLIAEIAGVVLLFILIEPLFKKLYRRWYSLPEE